MGEQLCGNANEDGADLLERLIALKYKLFALNSGDEAFFRNRKRSEELSAAILAAFIELAAGVHKKEQQNSFLCEIANNLFVFSTATSSISYDSVPRRSLFACMERILYLTLDAELFQSLPVQKSFFHLKRCFLALCETIQFSRDRLLFCGAVRMPSTSCALNNTLMPLEYTPEEDSTENQQQNSAPFLSICLLFIAFLADEKATDEEKQDQTCLKPLAHRFFARVQAIFADSPMRLVDVLIDHDERCLITLLALLSIFQRQQRDAFSLPKMFNPLQLFFLLLHRIDHDALVVVDWLSSETVAFAFLLRFLKHINSSVLSKDLNTEQLGEAFASQVTENINNDVLRISKLSAERRRWKVVASNSGEISGDNDSSHTSVAKKPFRFQITELHGEMLVQKDYLVKRQNTSLIVDDASSSSERTYFQQQQTTCVQEQAEKLAKFFIDLRVTLERCASSLPARVSPLIAQLLQIEQRLAVVFNKTQSGNTTTILSRNEQRKRKHDRADEYS